MAPTRLDSAAVRIFGIALLACMATAAASPAATDYWAFGDSITRGQGAVFTLDDLAPGQDCLTFNLYPLKCGYHWRLQDALTLAGITNAVLNRGVAGDNSILAKSRIDDAGEPLDTNHCTDPSAGDVLLLMEGTNDISGGLSTTTIKMNLEYMLDLATTKCVHGAVASTIRRLLAGTPLTSKTGDPFHPQTSDLATKISALAGEKNRAYVNVWGSLCPNQPCYDFSFHGRLVLGDPGHPNSNGYAAMAPIFQAPITATPLPGSATLTAPSGDVTDSTPLFSWNEHANSDWYFLEVDGGAVYGRWHAEEEPGLCSGGVCSFDPALVLADGGHTWRVRTRNLRGVGSWSATSAFTVWTTLPGAATPTAPTGDGCEGTAGPYTPTFQWNEASDAKDYRLEVTDVVSAAVVLDQTISASGNCGGGSCTTAPTLGPGDYTWKVMAINPFGDGPWSADTAFSLFPSTLGAPTPVYPLDDVFDTTPTYRWTGVAGAETYDLDVDVSVATHTAASVCSGLACAVTGAALGTGAHTWEVTAKNRCDLAGAQSGASAFEVLTCSMPVDVDLADPGVVNGTVDEAACGKLRALSGYTVGGTGVVTFHAGSAVVLGDGFEVLSGGSFTARADY